MFLLNYNTLHIFIASFEVMSQKILTRYFICLVLAKYSKCQAKVSSVAKDNPFNKQDQKFLPTISAA